MIRYAESITRFLLNTHVGNLEGKTFIAVRVHESGNLVRFDAGIWQGFLRMLYELYFVDGVDPIRATE